MLERHSIRISLLVILTAVLSSPPALAELEFEVVNGFGRPNLDRSALVVGGDGAFYGTTPGGGSSNLGTIFRLDGAGNYTELHAFNGTTDGQSPSAYPVSTLVLGLDGALYGVAHGGPSNAGTVFRIDGSGRFSVLHSFSGTDGAIPKAPLVLGSDGAFYGTTRDGGSTNHGTIFRIDSAGNFRSLHSFAGDDGSGSASPLVQANDGAFYGTTYTGGASNQGTVFRIDSAGTFTTVHSFDGTDGSSPSPLAALAVGSDGAIYGTTRSGGASGWGTVFRIGGTGSFTVVHSFSTICPTIHSCYMDGGDPEATLVLGSDNALYGATRQGGFTGSGAVFRIDGAGSFTLLHSFSGGSQYPDALIAGSDGAIYGTTTGNGFRVDSTGTLAFFRSPDGSSGPFGSRALVVGRDGALYGTTLRGGLADLGQFVRIDSSGTSSALYSFPGAAGGEKPLAALTLGADGALFGTTEHGGPRDMGTIFRIDRTGFTPLHSFSGTDGAYPTAPLVAASDGSVYGTAPSGGSSGNGAIFKVDPLGIFTSIHSFADHFGASAALIAGSAGTIYGSTGVEIFKIGSDATTTTVHSFENESDQCDGLFAQYASTNLVVGSDGALYGIHTRGFDFPYANCFAISTWFRIDSIGNFTSFPSEPASSLVVGSDGQIYGTTWGAIFRTDSAGNRIILHSFTGEDGSTPTSPLVSGTDGALYGTSRGGGPSYAGTAFRIDSAGNFSVLHPFSYTDGDAPSSLSLASDGGLYGSTFDGGESSWGTVFRIDPAGTFTSIHSFAYVDGYSPSVPPVEGGDCALYGTTAGGGPAGGGVVYRVFERGHLCQHVDFDPIPDHVVGDPPFTPVVAASSGLPVALSACGSCTVNGNEVTVTEEGVCTLTASQPGDADFEPASEVTRSFQVLPEPDAALSLACGAALIAWFATRGTPARSRIAMRAPARVRRARPMPCDSRT